MRANVIQDPMATLPPIPQLELQGAASLYTVSFLNLARSDGAITGRTVVPD